MSDGLLLTRGEKLRGFSERTGLILGPSLAVAIVVAATGDFVVATFVATLAVLAALGAGSSVKTRVGAAVLGVFLVALLIGILAFTSLVISTPFEPGF